MINPKTGMSDDSGVSKDNLPAGYSYNPLDAGYQSMSFGSADYDRLAAANPALQRQYGDLTLWDKIGNAFGFKTAEDRFKMDQFNDAANWDSQIASLKFENEYNSPSAQVQRERAAGINPDLAGGITPGTAGEMTEGEPRDVGADAASDTGKAFNFVQSALSFGLQFMTGLQSVNGIVLDNEGKSISNILAAGGLGASDALQDFGVQDPGVVLSKGYQEKPINTRNPFKPGSKYFRAYSRQWLGSYNNASQNYKTYFQNRNDFLQSLISSASNEAHPAFAGLPPEGAVRNYSDVIDAFRDFMKDTFELSKSKTKNDLEYQEGYNPTQAAEGENAENVLKEQQRGITEKLNEPLERLVTKLSKLSENDDVFASAVLMFLYAFSSGAIKF